MSAASRLFLWLVIVALLLSAAPAFAAPPSPGGAPALTSSPPTSNPTTRSVRRRFTVATATTAPSVTNLLPSLAAQQQAQSKIREIYSTDYADTSFNARRALARRLIADSAQTRRDSDAKYVLLREARDLAADAGDVFTSFDAIDCLVDTFPLNKLNERVLVLQKSVPVLSTPQAQLAAASICMDLVDQCIIEGDYDRADLLLLLAADCASRAQSRSYAYWIDSHAASIRPLKAAYDLARPAQTALVRDPNDPQANLVVGHFITFIKGDFDAGLLMLAKGCDPQLAALADQDLDTPADRPSLQFKTAGAWWELADSQPSDCRAAIRRRAGYWYRLAIPNLDGLDRALAQRRLLELNPPSLPKALAKLLAHPPDALKLNGHWYRASIAEVSWETAHRLCQEAGGQIVSIETRAEGDLMTRLAHGRMLWLGGSVDSSGRWTWLSGAEFFYSNWAVSQPAAVSPDVHPLTNPDGSWKTSTGRAGFICEWTD